MKYEFSKKDLGLLLKKYTYWTLYLSPKQYYLGKLKLVLNRKQVIDFCELTTNESRELISTIKVCRKALVECFKPDLFNYATLGNCIRHHHWHIIPRYKTKRIFDNVIFQDEHWNNPSWPNPDKLLKRKTIKAIKDCISEKLR